MSVFEIHNYFFKEYFQKPNTLIKSTPTSMKLKLKRPLVFFDLETTGTNVYQDRIVEISVLKVMPDGTKSNYTRRVNPQIHIPEEASAVHHITDADVKDEPPFSTIAEKLAKYFEGCDIAGFNSNRFDVPLLRTEFHRAGVDFNTSDMKFIDVQTIYHKREPRTLVAAYKYYCGKDLAGAHAAEADINATYEVLLGQLDMYDDLPVDVEALAGYTTSTVAPNLPEGMSAVDCQGRLMKNSDGVILFNFGRYKGQPVKKVFIENPGMADWCVNPARNFSPDLLKVFKQLKQEAKS